MQNDIQITHEADIQSQPQNRFFKRIIFFFLAALAFFALWAFLASDTSTSSPTSPTPEQAQRQDLQSLTESETENALLISRLKLQDLPKAQAELLATQTKVDNLQSALTQARGIRLQIQEMKTKIINGSYFQTSPQPLTEEQAKPEVQDLSIKADPNSRK